MRYHPVVCALGVQGAALRKPSNGDGEPKEIRYPSHQRGPLGAGVEPRNRQGRRGDTYCRQRTRDR